MTEPDFISTTRTSYNTVANNYAQLFKDELGGKPFDRGALTAFAEDTTGVIADIGCGPGELTAYLNGLGRTAFGIDLSTEMIAVARQNHPDLRFEQGSMLALDIPDGTLGGIVAYYSTIHIPTELLPQVFAEFHRVLAPGGKVLLAFQAGEGDETHLTEAFGGEVSLHYYFRSPDQVISLLEAAGLALYAKLLREPDETEKRPRAYLLAAKAG